MADYSDLMTRFRRAYAAADPDQLAAVLGTPFEWHNHYFTLDDPRSTGRVLHGLDEMVTELQWRKANWTDVRFDGLIEHFAPGLVTQSFTISGNDRGTPFNNAAVDLYTLDETAPDDVRILKKDTYWKYAA